MATKRPKPRSASKSRSTMTGRSSRRPAANTIYKGPRVPNRGPRPSSKRPNRSVVKPTNNACRKPARTNKLLFGQLHPPVERAALGRGIVGDGSGLAVAGGGQPSGFHSMGRKPGDNSLRAALREVLVVGVSALSIRVALDADV